MSTSAASSSSLLLLLFHALNLQNPFYFFQANTAGLFDSGISGMCFMFTLYTCIVYTSINGDFIYITIMYCTGRFTTHARSTCFFNNTNNNNNNIFKSRFIKYLISCILCLFIELLLVFLSYLPSLEVWHTFYTSNVVWF